MPSLVEDEVVMIVPTTSSSSPIPSTNSGSRSGDAHWSAATSSSSKFMLMSSSFLSPTLSFVGLSLPVFFEVEEPRAKTAVMSTWLPLPASTRAIDCRAACAGLCDAAEFRSASVSSRTDRVLLSSLFPWTFVPPLMASNPPAPARIRFFLAEVVLLVRRFSSSSSSMLPLPVRFFDAEDVLMGVPELASWESAAAAAPEEGWLSQSTGGSLKLTDFRIAFALCIPPAPLPLLFTGVLSTSIACLL
mmetsp:Transcript_6991/g.16977  ORF Transcript_6991/g.16977 Transcript_6991/m.16977 type:complete len:246 (+) Transcript_6991:2206-2943(+)